jgi:hypothetical protein
MNNFFVRLLVAATCFALSVSLTNLLSLVRGHQDRPTLDVVLAESNINEEEQVLREIYREYGPAQTRHDRAFFKRIETEDFRLFYNNTSISREEDIRWMESMPTDLVYSIEPREIEIFRNSAVVRGFFEVRHPEGHIDRWETIDVWIKRGDQWQILSTTSGY